MPYTVLGDKNWKDYEVERRRVPGQRRLGRRDGARQLPRQRHGLPAQGLLSAAFGGWNLRLCMPRPRRRNVTAGTQLATGKAATSPASQWHNVKLRFSGTTITGFVDDVQVLTVTNTLYASGMAGLVTGGENNARNTALVRQPHCQHRRRPETPADGIRPGCQPAL